MIVAFIPARGGSKRLPRKNIKMFAGQPLIGHSIALAHATKRIEECVVSTDDEEIARIAERYGADVIERPAELAGDKSPTGAAAQHTLQVLRRRGSIATALVTLQPNCPLRPRPLLESALDLFASDEVDSVVSVTASTHKLGKIVNSRFLPSYSPGTRSQDLESAYYENGLVYVSSPSLVLETADLFGERILPLVTDPMYALGDIDTELDFQIAEFLFQQYRPHFAGAIAN